MAFYPYYIALKRLSLYLGIMTGLNIKSCLKRFKRRKMEKDIKIERIDNKGTHVGFENVIVSNIVSYRAWKNGNDKDMITISLSNGVNFLSPMAEIDLHNLINENSNG